MSTRIAQERDCSRERDVGAKLARQQTMRASGLPVPPFYCLTTAFYAEVFGPIREAVASRLASIDWNVGQTVKRAAREVQTLFTEVALTEAQLGSLLGAFDENFANGTLVSVRASIVGHALEESEDSATTPFAGMSETFLYVRREDIAQKVKLCWASGFSEECLLYRHALGLAAGAFDVAVGIQEMVFGERSFVLFTRNPTTAAHDCVIVAGHGIGEGVVQERVQVDHYFVNGTTGAITRELRDKTRMLTMDDARGHGLIERTVPPHLQQPSCLSDEEIRALAGVGRRLEALFGGPQDIEGTFTSTGGCFILQSRPIAFDYGRQRIWSSSNVTESYPGVSTALTYTFARFFYRTIFYDLYRRLGVPRATLHDNAEPLDRMLGFLGGRVYYCLSHFYLLHKQSPLFPIFGAHWEKMIGLPTSYEGGEPAPRRAWAGVPPALVATAYQYVTLERRMRGFHAWWDALVTPLRGKDFSREDPLRLKNRFVDLWKQVGDWWGVTLTIDAYLIPLYAAVHGLLEKWVLLEGAPGLLADLLCGDDEMMSVEILLSVVELAEHVRAEPSLLATFERHEGEALWEMTREGKLGIVFKEKVERHLDRFGDRGLQELKVEQPALRDTPWVLLRMVRTYARKGVTVAGLREQAARVRRDAEAVLRAKLRTDRVKWRVLDTLLARLRRLILHRENSRYCRAELFGVSRKIFLGIGASLVRMGVLRSLDDVHHLTQDEIFGYVDGTGVTQNLQGVADLRRVEYERNLARELPEQITTHGSVGGAALDVRRPQAGATHAGGALVGLGSCGGRVRGTARVVTDPNALVAIDPDMILIARETDPGWLFLMLASKGIVVERGSMLSHTAITGRTLGVPTIVALSDATTRIPDGARIEICGSTGTVVLLDDEIAHEDAAAAE